MYQATRLPDYQKDQASSFHMEGRSWATVSALYNDQTNLWGVCLVLCSQYGFEAERDGSFGDSPQAARMTLESFYVDDGLMGADTVS